MLNKKKHVINTDVVVYKYPIVIQISYHRNNLHQIYRLVLPLKVVQWKQVSSVIECRTSPAKRPTGQAPEYFDLALITKDQSVPLWWHRSCRGTCTTPDETNQ